MIEIACSQYVATNPSNLLSTLLDHDNLSRFFRAQISTHRTATQHLTGGVGCVREVRHFPFRFFELIEKADLDGIRYRILGQVPLRDHRGEITFQPHGLGTYIAYRISGTAPWWLPSGILRSAISREIQRALKNLAAYYAQR
ncbi:SRPBCC family protein [Pseudoalteromonas fenneropenaei]|uniref:SRPBCC family protein n=1 Tax=Pseudoalteromonas fenneropenaei TaxID=1737459 RepID=A0ABV7CCB0_9GAMM